MLKALAKKEKKENKILSLLHDSSDEYDDEDTDEGDNEDEDREVQAAAPVLARVRNGLMHVTEEVSDYLQTSKDIDWHFHSKETRTVDEIALQGDGGQIDDELAFELSSFYDTAKKSDDMETNESFHKKKSKFNFRSVALATRVYSLLSHKSHSRTNEQEPTNQPEKVRQEPDVRFYRVPKKKEITP